MRLALAALAVGLVTCTQAQLQQASVDLQNACALYASVAMPLAQAPDKTLQTYLAYGNSVCDAATGQVKPDALASTDAHTAAWVGAIAGAAQALASGLATGTKS